MKENSTADRDSEPALSGQGNTSRRRQSLSMTGKVPLLGILAATKLEGPPIFRALPAQMANRGS